ncbi:DoxX family protein [Neobacillus ginsengisoli]|uniref:Oxidoreductase n=1 Tax=Neobacillus ginsengisoli TaxID=904295 RepID=A0ABT9XWP4_9BACI|nr:DoxX family protein [Neobacillus ginsengisoli]MDQ0199929.1 putative oxidoreductase [Neobacillus ginsengisoli]
MADLGLLIIRLVVGLTFVGHGAQKLFGWFGGPGPIKFGEWLGTIGITTGGLLFSAGELTWLGAILIIIVMIDAIFTVHGKNGFWLTDGGYEYNLILIAIVLGVALIGPGDYVLIYKM